MIKKISKVLFFSFLAVALLSNCQAKKEKGTKSGDPENMRSRYNEIAEMMQTTDIRGCTRGQLGGLRT